MNFMNVWGESIVNNVGSYNLNADIINSLNYMIKCFNFIDNNLLFCKNEQFLVCSMKLRAHNIIEEFNHINLIMYYIIYYVWSVVMYTLPVV